jgi:hypothetical protein
MTQVDRSQRELRYAVSLRTSRTLELNAYPFGLRHASTSQSIRVDVASAFLAFASWINASQRTGE